MRVAMAAPSSACRHILAATLVACLASEVRVDAFSIPARTVHTTTTPTTRSATLLPRSLLAASGRPATALSPIGPSPFFRSSVSLSSSSSDLGVGTDDELLVRTSNALRRASWISWWAQVILTTVSSVILLFARNIGLQQSSQQIVTRLPSGGFVFAGSGIVLSVMSVFWTWGGARLSRRLLRGNTSRITAANLVRRAIKVGASVNMMGMLITLVGAFVIIGELATKVLTTQGFSPFGAGAAVAAGAVQTIQPLDILIVQGNFNTLLSHFSSLFFTLLLTRFVDRLDPPSKEDDPRD